MGSRRKAWVGHAVVLSVASLVPSLALDYVAPSVQSVFAYMAGVVIASATWAAAVAGGRRGELQVVPLALANVLCFAAPCVWLGTRGASWDELLFGLGAMALLQAIIAFGLAAAQHGIACAARGERADRSPRLPPGRAL